jgi:hypothetical protein
VAHALHGIEDLRQYRKKPLVIEAVRWEGDFLALSNNLPLEAHLVLHTHDTDLIVRTLEGPLRCNVGDYLVRGIKGEWYPVRADIFEESYEPFNGEGGP